MKKATWNRTIPGVLLFLLALFGAASGGNAVALLLLGGLGIVLIAFGMADKSEERV